MAALLFYEMLMPFRSEEIAPFSSRETCAWEMPSRQQCGCCSGSILIMHTTQADQSLPYASIEYPAKKLSSAVGGQFKRQLFSIKSYSVIPAGYIAEFYCAVTSFARFQRDCGPFSLQA